MPIAGAVMAALWPPRARARARRG
eukprot:COSAG01_NODE_40361_length_464_cov_8.353425_2_plen_23_part_01